MDLGVFWGWVLSGPAIVGTSSWAEEETSLLAGLEAEDRHELALSRPSLEWLHWLDRLAE